MSDITPLDVLGQKFSKRFQGYDPQQVHEFLASVANTIENLTRERGELRQQIRSLEAELASFRKREHALQEALVAAQRSADDTLDAARAEGEKIVAEAQALADQLVEDASNRIKTIETVIGDLRARRREVRAELMRLAELLQGLIHDDQQLEKQEPQTPRLTVLNRRNANRREG